MDSIVPIPRTATADGLVSSSAASAAVAPTTEAIIASYTVSAGFYNIGTVLELAVSGLITTPATAATLTLRVRRNGLAGTILATITNTNTAVAVTNAMWRADFLGTMRATGATGAMWMDGIMWSNYVPAIVAGSAGPMRTTANAAAVTYDTTVQHTLDVTAQWSVAGTFSITAQQFLVSLLKA